MLILTTQRLALMALDRELAALQAGSSDNVTIDIDRGDFNDRFSSHSLLARRCAMISSTADTMLKGSMPICTKRLMVCGASLV